MAVAVMRLAAQVADSPSELAALTLDAIAACLQLQEAADMASPDGDPWPLISSSSSVCICLVHPCPYLKAQDRIALALLLSGRKLV